MTERECQYKNAQVWVADAEIDLKEAQANYSMAQNSQRAELLALQQKHKQELFRLHLLIERAEQKILVQRNNCEKFKTDAENKFDL